MAMLSITPPCDHNHTSADRRPSRGNAMALRAVYRDATRRHAQAPDRAQGVPGERIPRIGIRPVAAEQAFARRKS
jgi:hypothetical protein